MFNSPTFNPVFFRTYSRRKPDNTRETFLEVVERQDVELKRLGLDEKKRKKIKQYLLEGKVFTSGRMLWVGGTNWAAKPENYSGLYNCTSTVIDRPEAFGWLMDLAMMGSGTGADLTKIDKLPPVRCGLDVTVVGNPGDWESFDDTEITWHNKHNCTLVVGDSRKGWVDAYQFLIDCAMSYIRPPENTRIAVEVVLKRVRQEGKPLKGFGGVANPVELHKLFPKVAKILNGAIGRQLTSVECSLLIDEAAKCVVAGNIRRSAGMRQAPFSDKEWAQAKLNLWQQGENGTWYIDPDRDALRMANHTRVITDIKDATYEAILESVKLQYHCGEGALMFAPNAIARTGNSYGFGLNPCGEILGENFHCNLAEVHLNQLDPNNIEEQIRVFRAAARACLPLLTHKFTNPVYQESRERDPIIGVSFTGLFDFFVNAFGREWLEWWQEGRPRSTAQGKNFIEKEEAFLVLWRSIVKDTVESYCRDNNLKIPTRYTTVQPAGTKSLLTNASPGWHPPKAITYIRRITFKRDDPVATGCASQGYKIVPSQSCKHEDGTLLDEGEIYHERCTEWLVEIPVRVPWYKVAEGIDPSKFSALAQLDFYMQVQEHYTTHNTSGTLELREDEIESVARKVHELIHSGAPYISVAMLARFDDHQAFPRLPFEPISEEEYLYITKYVKELTPDQFRATISLWDDETWGDISPAPCDSDICLLGTENETNSTRNKKTNVIYFDRVD